MAKLVAAVAAAALVMGTTALLAGGPSGLLLPAPAVAEASAEWLPDGMPVFVVRHSADDVSVLAAPNPHLGILVAWCPDARRFVEPGPGSTFDAHGYYLGGPAPAGLVPYDARIVHDREGDGGGGGPAQVAVGPRGQAPSRGDSARRAPESRPPSRTSRCMPEEGRGGVRHDLDALGPVRAPSALGWDDRGRFVRLRGLLSFTDAGARLCDVADDATDCGQRGVAVRSVFPPRDTPEPFRGWRGWIRGDFLARVEHPRAVGDFVHVAGYGPEGSPYPQEGHIEFGPAQQHATASSTPRD